MTINQAAKRSAKKVTAAATLDRQEDAFLMEPLLIREGSSERAALTDLALELAQKSAGLRRSLPQTLVPPLADLVRSMNCYYSNLIEGHNTHPIDIERALNNGEYSQDPVKKDLQLEAKAHITVQQWIDAGSLDGRAFTRNAIMEIHQRFCENLPDDLLWAEDPTTGKRIAIDPGKLREHDVKVGRHIPISFGAIPRFLERYEDAYAPLGKAETIIAAAAAHHRLLWIHPFADGNGRVARLVSHAAFLDVLDSGGVWSVARGLARSVDRYKAHLADCDLPRRNDLDGRGALSEETLTKFTRYFLLTCIDQVAFMETLMQPEQLRVRIQRWTDDEVRFDRLHPQSGAVLEALLYRGEITRAAVPRILNSSERSARRVVSLLLKRGAIRSESTRGPLRLAFPAALAMHWMPGLFPDRV